MKKQRNVYRAGSVSAISVLGAALVSLGALGVGGLAPGQGQGSATEPSRGAEQSAAPVQLPDTVSFANDVLPIFRQRCAECHGAEDENGEVRTEVSLNLLEYERVMAGSEFGTVIEAGDPANSFLLDMIVDGTMPEQGDPVPEEEIAVIRAWIEAGAPNN